MSLLMEGLTNYRAEVATLPSAVYVWMWTMRTVLIAGGLVFIGTRAGQIVFPIMALNILGLWFGKGLWPELSLSILGTGLHLLLWVPMGIGLIVYLRAKSGQVMPLPAYHRLSYYWAAVALAVIAISLVLDVKALVAVMFQG